jgi:hypothetical protein
MFRKSASLFAVALALAMVGCAEGAPLSPGDQAPAAQLATLPGTAEANLAIAKLRRSTARYHDVDAAVADGFLQVEECEERPGEGQVGVIYGNPSRIDANIDPSAPEALLYEPAADGRMSLVGVELVIPYAQLRNAGLQPAFMHNGAFLRLEDAIRYHLDAVSHAAVYSTDLLPPDLRGPIDPMEPVLEPLDPLLGVSAELTEAEFDALVDFVRYGLLDPAAHPQRLRRLVPEKLPSGSANFVFQFP